MTKHESYSPSESIDRLEEQIRQYSRSFAYPPTPNLSKKMGYIVQQEKQPQRGLLFSRPAWIVSAVLILLALLFSVPTVRAQILEFIQIGRVKIFLVEPTPVPTTTPLPPTSTPLPADSVHTLQGIAGEVSFTEAAGKISYPVELPTYPVGLGKPDHVFIQDLGEPVLILVWMDPNHTDQVLLSLSFIPEGSFALEKVKPRIIQETTVNGQPAVWTEGPYILKLKNGDIDLRRFIKGNVLIWEDKTITYRLETGLSMENAVKIAESLKTYTP